MTGLQTTRLVSFRTENLNRRIAMYPGKAVQNQTLVSPPDKTTRSCGEQRMNLRLSAIRARFVPLWFLFLTPVLMRAEFTNFVSHAPEPNQKIPPTISIISDHCKTPTSKPALRVLSTRPILQINAGSNLQSG